MRPVPHPLAVRAAALLLSRTVRGDVAAVFLGDLIEDFQEHRSHTRFALHTLSVSAHGVARSIASVHTGGNAERATRMGSLFMDLKFALRSLSKRPAFAAIVLFTLALGIGAATAIFSIAEGILFRPLPFSDSDRLVAANEMDGEDRMSFAWPNFVDVRDRARSFESIACHQANALNIVGDGPARRVNARLVCASFFDVLRVPMQAGRTFTPDEDKPGASPVAIVSDRFWREDLGGDPSVIGRTLRTTEMTFTIVGVLPPAYRFTRPEDVYVPVGLTMTPDSGWLDRGNHVGLAAVGRLAPGVGVAQADEELKRIAADLRRAYPNTNARSSAQALLLQDRIVGDVRGTLQALLGAVGFLLLLACVNVANLFVARGAARRQELAIRAALGGTRGRVMRELVVETTLLSAGGAALGIGIAYWLLELLIAIAPEGIPRIEDIGLNSASLLFAVGAAATFVLVFGGFPALQATSPCGAQILTRASGMTAVTPRRTRRFLMGIEVALALVLLAGCGLMARTMLRLTSVDPGFEREHLLTARVVLSGTAWSSVDRRQAYYDAVLERVRRLPGVASAALTLSLPIEGSNWGSIFTVRDKPVPPRAELPSAAFVPVSAEYFKTMGISLRAGRAFTDGDNQASQRVTIVNEAFARRLWPGENPIGKFIKQGWPETPETDAPWREVVGLVPDIKLDGVDQDVPLQAYLPLRQESSRSVAIVARTLVPPESLARQLEMAVQSVEKNLPVTRVLPMTALMSSAIARQRLSTVILAVFAGIALVLAAVGLYGVVSQNVTERTREIGLRMALGSGRGAVLRLFVLNGIAIAAVGTVAGLAGAYFLSRWMASMLFEVEPTDALTFTAVPIVLLLVAAIACYIPARRAARLDPLQALRQE